MRIHTLFLLIGLILISCTKESLQPNPTCDRYTIMRDWYTMDTVFVSRAVLWTDAITDDKIKKMLELVPNTWYIMCETYINPRHLEHWYYLKNGIKIHPSVYPKN